MPANLYYTRKIHCKCDVLNHLKRDERNREKSLRSGYTDAINPISVCQFPICILLHQWYIYSIDGVNGDQEDKVMNQLQQCDELKKKLDALRPFPAETLRSLREYYRVGLTYSSNALEGNSLTESETKVVIEDGLTVQGKPLCDVYEALGHAEAYDHLQLMATDKQLEVSDILKLHELFYKRIDPSQAGKFRTVPVFISGSHYPLPPPEQIPMLVDELLAWYRQHEPLLHPLELAALVHQKFVFIHPFVDGNGRVARLLMNLVLLRFGYPITIIPPILRLEYIATLEKAHHSTNEFIQFVIVREIETLRELLRLLGCSLEKTAAIILSHGAAQVLQLLQTHSGWRVPNLAEALQKSRPTIERRLRELRNADKIEFRGAPKNGGYFTK